MLAILEALPAEVLIGLTVDFVRIIFKSEASSKRDIAFSRFLRETSLSSTKIKISSEKRRWEMLQPLLK